MAQRSPWMQKAISTRSHPAVRPHLKICLPGGAGNWTETQVGGELGSATGIAIDGAGDLYIADQANREIVKETFTLNGYLQSVIASQSNGLNGPTGVAVDESGNVYVTDPGVSNGVFKETPSVGGYVQSVIPTSTLSQPGGIAVDSIGSVYIADTNNDRVLKETPSGASYTESTIGAGLSSPTAVAVDGFGNVYVSENSAGVVLKETLVAGSYVQSTVASGLQPYGLAVDGSLNLYIAGSSSRPLVKLDVSDGPGLSFANTEVGQVRLRQPEDDYVLECRQCAFDASHRKRWEQSQPGRKLLARYERRERLPGCDSQFVFAGHTGGWRLVPVIRQLQPVVSRS